MLILGIILFGMLIGAGAQLILGRGGAGINWPLAFAAGLIGSFVGGLLISLIAGADEHAEQDDAEDEHAASVGPGEPARQGLADGTTDRR